MEEEILKKKKKDIKKEIEWLRDKYIWQQILHEFETTFLKEQKKKSRLCI